MQSCNIIHILYYFDCNNRPTFPTPSGITKQQAVNACEKSIQRSPIYILCRDAVKYDGRKNVQACTILIMVCSMSLVFYIQITCLH